MADKPAVAYVQSVSVKKDTGELSSPYPIGVNFDNVIDSTSKHTLKQFYDSYIAYMENADFVYYGPGPTAPANKHIRMWIDTSETQNDFSS